MMTNVFNLSDHIKKKPILDPAYERHLESADVFNAVVESRQSLDDALERRHEADQAVRVAYDEWKKAVELAKFFEELSDSGLAGKP